MNCSENHSCLSMNRGSLYRAIMIVVMGLLLLGIDQTTKFLVKTTMALHECHRVTDWFFIYFTENSGMAFGMELVGKIFLTSFRIVAVVAIIWFLCKCVKHQLKWGFIVCVTLIMTGALGNIIDCVFYGRWFSESTGFQTATFLPMAGGYAPLFYGKVVDMLYFPLIETDWPDWMPMVGGQHFIFFSPIFNFADACISTGIIALFLFYSKYLSLSFQLIKQEKLPMSEDQTHDNQTDCK